MCLFEYVLSYLNLEYRLFLQRHLFFLAGSRAHEIADRFFKQANGDSQHQVHAVGNCHIDCGMVIFKRTTISNSVLCTSIYPSIPLFVPLSADLSVRQSVCSSVHLSDCLTIRPSVRLFVRLSFCLPFLPPVRLSMRSFFHLSFPLASCPSIPPSTCPSICTPSYCPPVHPFVPPSVRPSTCPSNPLSVHLFVCPSTCPSLRCPVCPPVCPCAFPYVHLSAFSCVRSVHSFFHLFVCPSASLPFRPLVVRLFVPSLSVIPSFRPSIRPSVHPSVNLFVSVYLSIYLSICLPIYWSINVFSFLVVYSYYFYSLAVAYRRDHQKVWSQFCNSCEVDGEIPWLQIRVLTGLFILCCLGLRLVSVFLPQPKNMLVNIWFCPRNPEFENLQYDLQQKEWETEKEIWGQPSPK